MGRKKSDDLTKAANKAVKNLHIGHRQRVKDRFLAEGIDNFTEHQALELLLFYCYPQGDTNEFAHKFLNEYGSIQNLFDADVYDLMNTLKITQNQAVLLTLIPSLSKKYLASKWNDKKIVLKNVKTAGDYCISLFRARKYETFYVLCLDVNKQLISTNIISEGTVDEAHVYPRKVIESAIRFQSNSVILSHNHPGGTLAPSFSDLEITKRISETLSAIGIAVADHIIVCGDEFYSFAKEKLLD